MIVIRSWSNVTTESREYVIIRQQDITSPPLSLTVLLVTEVVDDNVLVSESASIFCGSCSWRVVNSCMSVCVVVGNRKTTWNFFFAKNWLRVLATLFFNSLRNEIEAVEDLILNNIDNTSFSETKLDEIFPNQQFQMFRRDKIFRRDENKHGGCVMFYINENIHCKTVNVEGLPYDCEVTLIELSFKSRKWLCIDLCKPTSQNEKYFLENLSLALTKIFSEYENVLLIGISTLLLRTKIFKSLWIHLIWNS